MKKSLDSPAGSKRGRYFVAMVLGTALSALGSSATAAPAQERAISAISRYCATCWRNARLDPACWPDCTQEVFCRLLERVAPEDWGQILSAEGVDRREFLRAIDAVKKRSQRSRKWAHTAIDAIADRHDLHERRLADHREAVTQAAAQMLSQRQQRILNLSFEGWTAHEIAHKLQIPAERVSDEKYKAIRKLRDHFQPV
ncbi:MAG TPA: sigma-70 family RNA polymerase sigma factor [Gemmataceae bacterium]|nr:sigma-70 family RNA polymerase sigma factor [Gemmataceae bacterium]